jgi:hypothetical protein
LLFFYVVENRFFFNIRKNCFYGGSFAAPYEWFFSHIEERQFQKKTIIE